jgi:hypothetical protein
MLKMETSRKQNRHLKDRNKEKYTTCRIKNKEKVMHVKDKN